MLKILKNTGNINPRISKTGNGKTMLLSKFAISGSKKSKFIKEQEANGLLSSLEIKTLLRKVPLLGNILFQMQYKMNEIVNKFLLARDKFMPEVHFKQPGFTYSDCGPFTKNREKTQKFKETGNSR